MVGLFQRSEPSDSESLRRKTYDLLEADFLGIGYLLDCFGYGKVKFVMTVTFWRIRIPLRLALLLGCREPTAAERRP